jgi:uncharacterized OsmC-like protein
VATNEKKAPQDPPTEVVAKADAIPAVYTDIDGVFTASGAVDRGKLERAVNLSMERYCSVATMLAPTGNITWRAAQKA